MSQSNFPHYFSGFVHEGKIFMQDYNGNQQVGVSVAVHNELQAKHDELKASYNEYQNKLIELGAIEVPMTPEDMIKKQSEQIAQLTGTVAQLANQIQTMSGYSHEHNVSHPECCRNKSKDEGNLDGSGSDCQRHGEAEQLETRTDKVRKPTQCKDK